jgi:hypothetical protein
VIWIRPLAKNIYEALHEVAHAIIGESVGVPDEGIAENYLGSKAWGLADFDDRCAFAQI